ncbi:aminoglycoside phosphotransferase family protein [Isoptericola sp. S6320L]|uniref:phosphotransferase family protein n=1 Tax=Isoptericola sp. S6320L TaxID=2926411 RepID=UPI001FF451C9|nr:aminoglycoside phosphotransferase family protein [Isoptericola sp. S6320L]MCK0118509.1 aminoglycoside phosphotransferase family protein [Isoptericola sp. S6320L]
MTVTTSGTRTSPHDHGAWRELLTGPAAESVLAAALGADGASLDTWHVRELHARPGAELTVAYDVVARRRHGSTESTAHEHLFATSAAGLDPGATAPDDGVVRLDDGTHALLVWRHPHDPALPGLAVGTTPARLTQRLREDGVTAEVLSLETVTYRPLRRAVLRARTTAGTLYVKVVRPTRVAALVQRHELFAAGDGLVAPRVLTRGEDGVVVLAELSGPSLADHLAATPAHGQPDAVDPAEIVRAAASLPPAGVGLSRRAPWADRLGRYTAALADAHGVDADRLARLAAGVHAALRGRDLGPVVATHGDLHAANVVLSTAGADGGPGAAPRVVGVLDVDTLGPGHLVDDLACAVAHLAVLPALAPGTYDGVDGLVERCLTVFGAEVDPVVLRARAAAVVVSLAVGAPDLAVADAWITVAERWVAAADGF